MLNLAAVPTAFTIPFAASPVEWAVPINFSTLAKNASDYLSDGIGFPPNFNYIGNAVESETSQDHMFPSVGFPLSVGSSVRFPVNFY